MTETQRPVASRPGQPPLPAYYTRLPPFLATFRTGVPILTYHKFGRPPRGARLRGLHLPTALLDQQCRELLNAGFHSVPLDAVLTTRPGTGVVFTIDDGFRSVVEKALPILRQHRVTAMLYLVADRLGDWNDWETAQGEVAAPLMNRDDIRDWLAAGQQIGSHTRTHPWLTRLTRTEVREELRASRAQLEDLFGVPIRHFCYPYGDWNPWVRDEVGEAGYLTAVTTEPGITTPGSDPLALRRFTARHASRQFRQWLSAWRRGWQQLRGRLMS